MNFEIIPIFPKCIIKTNIELDKEENIELLNSFNFETFEKVNNEPTAMEVSKNKKILNNFIFLKNKINNSFKLALKSILKIENDLIMTSSWLTKSEKNQFSDFHVHTNCVFSGVYYPNFNKEIPEIHFQKKTLPEISLNYTEYNMYNSNLITLKLEKNNIIFFSSDLSHKVAHNFFDSTRYSIAFNFFPTGKIGIHDSQMEIKVYE
jgi:uncharacterized protein (TIGR02466 family)